MLHVLHVVRTLLALAVFPFYLPAVYRAYLAHFHFLHHEGSPYALILKQPCPSVRLFKIRHRRQTSDCVFLFLSLSLSLTLCWSLMWSLRTALSAQIFKPLGSSPSILAGTHWNNAQFSSALPEQRSQACDPFWIDNESAVYSLAKGYSGAADSARVVNLYHACVAQLGVTPWLEYARVCVHGRQHSRPPQ